MAASQANLYIVKMAVTGRNRAAVKANLYSVKIVIYKAANGKKTQYCQNPGPRGPTKRAATARNAGIGNESRSVRRFEARMRRIITARCAMPCSKRPSGCSNATGLPGLTLRAVAREAGVSHAAPTHHFGDLTGMVSELAAIGFRQFNAAMVAAGAAAHSPLEKALARAKAYVAYAQAHPGMYGLMFRTERLDMSRPSLCEAANASFAGLAGAIGATRHEQISDQALSLEQAADIARAWSLVHGFTMLLLDGRLTDIIGRLPERHRCRGLAGCDAEARDRAEPRLRRKHHCAR